MTYVKRLGNCWRFNWYIWGQSVNCYAFRECIVHVGTLTQNPIIHADFSVKTELCSTMWLAALNFYFKDEIMTNLGRTPRRKLFKTVAVAALD